MNLPDDIDDDLLDNTPSLPGETVAEYAERIRKLSQQTPQQDREAALIALRDVLNNPRSKPADRKAAADSLLKAAADAGKATAATEQALAMSDEELLAVVHQARAARGAGIAVAVAPAVPTPSAGTTSPREPSGTPGSSFPLGGLDALGTLGDIDPLML